MGSIKYIFLLFWILTSPLPLFSQMQNDVKTTAAVTANSLAQQGIERLHNDEIRQVVKKKKDIAKYTAKMATLKELYRISMQNIDGFGQESKMYVAIATTAADIFVSIPIATHELLKRPYSALSCANDITNLTLEAQSLVNSYINIVNNGKVSIKIKDLSLYGADDGYNFINRTDRYVVANDILTRLLHIKYKLEGIIYLSRFCNGLSDLIYALDVDTWYSYFQGRSQLETVIRSFRHL